MNSADEECISSARQLLLQLLSTANVDSGHDIHHADAVLSHMRKALIHEDLDQTTCTNLLLAALLHDADDHKFFSTVNDANARRILEDSKASDPETVIALIRSVSCSGSVSLPQHLLEKPWARLPMYCDRLEALGEVGIARAVEYSRYTGRPLRTPDTPIARTLQELKAIATPERYSQYRTRGGGSVSTLDHMYDKVLHLGNPDTCNEYILTETSKRMNVIVKYVLSMHA